MIDRLTGERQHHDLSHFVGALLQVAVHVEFPVHRLLQNLRKHKLTVFDVWQFCLLRASILWRSTRNENATGSESRYEALSRAVSSPMLHTSQRVWRTQTITSPTREQMLCDPLGVDVV